MKKIIAISGFILGAVLLSGCGNISQKDTTQSKVNQPPATPSAPANLAPTNSSQSMTPDASTTTLPTTPAKTSDVDSSMTQIDKDLKSLDSSAPSAENLNSTDFE